MKRTLIACTLAFALLATYAFVAQNRERAVRESVEAKIERLADAVDRLTTLMERVLLERDMADVNLVDGNTTVPNPQVITWKSGGQSIQLTVHKESVGQSSADYTAWVQTCIGRRQGPGSYPPD